MVSRRLSQALLVSGVLLLLWGTLSAARPLRAFDGEYLLLLEDKPVGRVFFRLRLTQDSYSFEALTTPFDQDQAGEPEHEVLEVSEGRWDDSGPVPSTYLFNVRDRDGNHLFEQLFDWPDNRLLLQTDADTKAAPLETGTQDRISYLLRLALAVANQESILTFPVAAPEQTTRMLFKLARSQVVDLSVATVDAIGVECFIDDEIASRTVWIAPELAFVPVLIERNTPQGQVRMYLESWRHNSNTAP